MNHLKERTDRHDQPIADQRLVVCEPTGSAPVMESAHHDGPRAHAPPAALAAMATAAVTEWQTHAPDDWTTIDFRDWPRGFHRSAWVIAGNIRWNPLEVFDRPTPASRAVNALLTRQCVMFTIVMTRYIPDPEDPDEPLLAWFNVARDEFQHDIATMIEGLGDMEWGLPKSRRWAARRLVKMWERTGVAGFCDLSVSLNNKPNLRAPDGGDGTGHA
ncbi:MAG: hypothetical protein HIU90_07540 [Proteobacteria bacterium]|nr:hypothetical protein [Pseudomonadota bacterium]